MRSPWALIGWRNLGRNRRRTLLTAGGLAVGYVSVVVIAGLTEGIVDEMLRNGTGVLPGQIQIHGPGYLPDRDLYRTIGGRGGIDVAALLAAAEREGGIAAAAPRVYAGGLVSTGAATAGAVFVGVDAERERRTTLLLTALSEGRDPAPGARELLIGRDLARLLAAGIGDEVVVVAPAADGSLGNDLFTVSGIFTTGMAELDLATVVLPLDVLQELLVLPPGRIHEVAVKVPRPWDAPAIATALQARLGPDTSTVVVVPWTTFRPEMADYAQLAEGSYWIVLVIVFVMAIFGVANTMLMATFERRYEIALLLTLGGSPWGLVRSILVEALALGTISIGVGSIVSVGLLVWWHHVPLDLSRVFEGFRVAGSFVRPVMRAEYPVAMFFEAAVALIATAVLASIYPAFRATRTAPAETLAGR